MTQNINNRNISEQQLSRMSLTHNPYVGTFHRNRRFLAQNAVYLPSLSPHVGTFRHAPRSQNLKELIVDGDDVTLLSSPDNKNKYTNRHIQKQVLDQIPMSLFTVTNSKFDDVPTCLICLDCFADGDEIRNLPCGHCFHKKCVDIWLLGTLSEETTYTSICPTCRRDASSTTSSCQSEEIPLESYVRIGQHLFEEGGLQICIEKTPSPPLYSPNNPQYSPRLDDCISPAVHENRDKQE